MANDGPEYTGVSELAEAVGVALSEIADGDRRMKSGATEIPSERTIRFYLDKQLLPKPTKRVGQTLVFGRIHLLHLLVIKKLQADGVPLSAIPDILKKKGRTEEQLEKLLDEDVQIFRSRRDLDEFRRRTGHTDDSDVVASMPQAMSLSYELPEESPEAPAPPTRSLQSERKEAKSFLEGLIGAPLRRRREVSPPQMMARPPKSDVSFSMAEFGAPQGPAKWTRHELLPGLELNISDDYEPPKDDRQKTNLLEKLRKILGL